VPGMQKPRQIGKVPSPLHKSKGPSLVRAAIYPLSVLVDALEIELSRIETNHRKSIDAIRRKFLKIGMKMLVVMRGFELPRLRSYTCKPL